MRFWDTSAIIPLIVSEPSSESMRTHLRNDAEIVVWWATSVECESAIGRLAAAGEMDQSEISIFLDALRDLEEAWEEVAPTQPLRSLARRLLRVHPLLRAADALQLAAALGASEGAPETLEFLTLDERLRSAAIREGLRAI